MRYLLCCLCLMAWSAPGVAAVLDGDCKAAFRRKAFATAGDCFAQRIPKQLSNLSSLGRVVMGRRIRNAALSYHRASSREPAPGKAAYYREQAVVLLRRYLRHRLFESQHRKTSAIVLLHGLQEQLFYVPLTLLTQHPQASIKIRGFRFQSQAKGRWSQGVRPGTYQIEVRYPKPLEIHRKEVRITARHPRIVRFRRKARPRSSAQPGGWHRSPASWWLMGAGGLVLATAGLVFGVAHLRADEARKLDATTPKTYPLAQQIGSLEDQANALVTTSLVCLLVGGAAFLAGGVLVFIPVSQPRPSSGRELPPRQPGAVLIRTF